MLHLGKNRFGGQRGEGLSVGQAGELMLVLNGRIQNL